MPIPNDPIQHVILLVLENHSFDQMLGCFKKVYPALEGIDPHNPGKNQDKDGNWFIQESTTARQMKLDPKHEAGHVSIQLEDGNMGFVRNFSEQYPESTSDQRQQIMSYYDLDTLPALHALARDFTICDNWHASVPGPTWPNRFFALSGSCNGHVSMPESANDPDVEGFFNEDQDTIFDRLNEKGIKWKSFFHDFPCSWVMKHQRDAKNASNYFKIDEFYKLAQGTPKDFPQFVFIEPHYSGRDQNDDHPPHDVMKAQKLIADVYNALRSNPDLWKSCLFMLFYDEHGGFYDHVRPPRCVAPDRKQNEMSFHQLGVRVPALIVSPYAKKGFIHTLFDHTSFLKYLIEKWELRMLGERVKNANSIQPFLSEAFRLDTVPKIKLTPDQLKSPDPAAENESALTSHHQAIGAIARMLCGQMKDEGVADLDELTPEVWSDTSRLFELIENTADRFLQHKKQ